MPVGEAANLTSSPGPVGEAHSLVWDSGAPPNPVGNSSSVRVRITPSDAFATGGAGVTDPFTVQNENPPITFITSPSDNDLIEGDVDVDYVLADTDPVPDPASIQVSGKPADIW